MMEYDVGYGHECGTTKATLIGYLSGPLKICFHAAGSYSATKKH